MWLSHEFHQFFLKKTQVPNWSEKNPDDGLSRMSNFQAGISYDQSIIGTSGARICDVCVCVSTMHVYIYIYTISYIITTYVCGYPCANMLFLSHLDECSLSTTSILPWLPPNHFPATPRPWISQHHPMHVPKGRAIQCQVSILQRWHRGFTCNPEAFGVYPIKLQFIITWGSFRVGLYILGEPQLLRSAFKDNAPRNFHLHNSLPNLEQTSPT